MSSSSYSKSKNQILCSEVLSGLCRNAQLDRSMEGLRVATASPRINHILFADDTMFFIKANVEDCKTLSRILRQYEMVSGQQINTQKSSITFSAKTPQATRDQLKRLLSIDKEGGCGKYLGLPELFGRKKKDLFTSIVDRIRQRAVSWSSKRLSAAGKLTMLKSVLLPIPTYTLSCFKIPKGLCRRIQSSLTRFWWDKNSEKKGMCWLAWNKLTKSKRDGGLGLRDIERFNDSLLVKQSWRILKNPSCLLARVLFGKYCKKSSFLETSCPNSASHGWRSLIVGRDLLKPHIGKVIGDGVSTKIWNEPWISTHTATIPFGPPTANTAQLRVSDLFLPNSREWDIPKVKKILPEQATKILCIKPSVNETNDSFVWLPTTDGVYTSKSGYHASKENSRQAEQLVNNPSPNFWNNEVWSSNISPKICLFLWNVMQGVIPIGENLAKRTLASAANCKRCGELETTPHIFFHCAYAQQVWRSIAFLEDFDPMRIAYFISGIHEVKKLTCLPPLGTGTGPILPWVCWYLWKARNRLVFEDKSIPTIDTSSLAIKGAREWQQVQANSSAHKATPCSIYVTSPQGSNITMFTDASWHEETQASGLAWVLPHSQYNDEHRGSTVKSFVSSPLVAEALAILEGLRDCRRLGHTKIQVCSDSLQLINAINSKQQGKRRTVSSATFYLNRLYVRHVYSPMFQGAKTCWPIRLPKTC